ncbi:MAG: fibronectin type III domain-containing protein [Pseudomonadota bacterium]
MMALAVLLLGCGIKSAPLPATMAAPLPPPDLKARAVERGVEVSFSVPAADQSDKQVVEAWLYYAYLPKNGDPDCPPCPPRLKRYYQLNLAQQRGQMEGGRFTYLDTQAPMEQQAAYQVRLVDARGRAGVVSAMTTALRVELPAVPQGLVAELGERQVDLSWQPVATLASGQPTTDRIGYILYRKAGALVRALNERPMSSPGLVDRSVSLGQVYEYQVAAARMIGDYVVVGRPTNWVAATVASLEPPSPPTGLVGASLGDGIYLRFTPSPQQDTAGYNIMRSESKDGPWRQINQGLNRENTFVDKDVKVGGTYYYRVEAVNERGLNSEPSQVIEVQQQP